MPLFDYTAKRGPGDPEQGTLRAPNQAEALARLETQGFTPIRIREAGGDSGRRRRRMVRSGEVTQLTRQLAGMLKAGVPILRALDTLSAQSGHGGLTRLVNDLAATIRNGATLSSAIAMHPRVFPPVYISMVRVGESAGALDRILLRLAEDREKQEDQRRRVQAAVAYPLLLVGVGAITVFVLVAFFMPRVAAMFDGWARLPWPTRIVLALSDWVSAYRWPILLAIALPIVLLHRLGHTARGRLAIDRRLLRLPLAGRFLLYNEVARFCRTLALLIEAGVGIAPALALAADTIRNRALRDDLETVQDATVRQGRAFSEGLGRGSVFPPFLATMTAVGEESGRIDETLNETAAYYEREIERVSKLITTLLEPVLILVIGGLVGFIVAAMLLPIFEIGSGAIR